MKFQKSSRMKGQRSTDIEKQLVFKIPAAIVVKLVLTLEQYNSSDPCFITHWLKKQHLSMQVGG